MVPPWFGQRQGLEAFKASLRRETAVLLCLAAVSGQPDVKVHIFLCHSGLTKTLQDTTRIGRLIPEISNIWENAGLQLNLTVSGLNTNRRRVQGFGEV